MSARNDITGDAIQSKALSKEGRENYDRIFRKIGKITIDESAIKKDILDGHGKVVGFVVFNESIGCKIPKDFKGFGK